MLRRLDPATIAVDSMRAAEPEADPASETEHEERELLHAPLAPRLVAFAQNAVSARDKPFDLAMRAIGGSTRRVSVAMIDGAFDTSQPVLIGKLRVMHAQDGADALSLRHGTHVAGLVTRGTRQIDALGFPRPQGTVGPGVAAAIAHAAAEGARVMNMSFGVSTKSDFKIIRDAVATHPDILFVVAAGNMGAEIGRSDETLLTFDQESFGFFSFAVADRTLDNLVLVAASDAQGLLSDQSNYGAPCVHLAAPGVNVLSSVPGGFAYESGTSMAAPQVTNLAAKCLLLNPTLTPAALKRLLIASSTAKPGWSDKIVAAGPIDPTKAYQHALASRSVLQADE